MTDTVDRFATRLAASLGPASGTRRDPRPYRTLLRLLAGGEPVGTDRLAAAAGRSDAEVRRYLAGRAESPCRATGRLVRLTVGADGGIGDLDPAGAVVSVVICDARGSTRTAFCDQVHFFADRAAASGWLADHPDGAAVPVADARRLTEPLASRA